MRSHAACGLSASIQRLSISDLRRVKGATVCGWCRSCHVQTKEFTGRDDSSDGRGGEEFLQRGKPSLLGSVFISDGWRGSLSLAQGKREGESDPEVGQWEGTGSRLHHYHQYGDEVGCGPAVELGAELAVKNSRGHRRDRVEKDLCGPRPPTRCSTHVRSVVGGTEPDLLTRIEKQVITAAILN